MPGNVANWSFEAELMSIKSEDFIFELLESDFAMLESDLPLDIVLVELLAFPELLPCAMQVIEKNSSVTQTVTIAIRLRLRFIASPYGTFVPGLGSCGY